MYRIRRCPLCGHPVHIHNILINSRNYYLIKNKCDHISWLETRDYELPSDVQTSKDWDWHKFTQQEVDMFFNKLKEWGARQNVPRN